MQVESFGADLTSDQEDSIWRDTAHTLKGASRGVGAWALGDICEDAEKLIGDIPGKKEKRAALLVSMRQLVADIIDEVRELNSL